ncbi:hypothetical protein [Zhongshania sp.]|uniref:hypothetical protein n=1 Tax=Zhongshania sp. TaxID=1971902 RepID=UPI00356463BC
MMKRTILTIEQQHAFLSGNWRARSFCHKWSTNGYGSSTILDAAGDKVCRVGGCGFDRFGTALGEWITATFPRELAALAKRECKKPYGPGEMSKRWKNSDSYYGLFLRDGKGAVDGGCGSDCMRKILARIGFEITIAGQTERARTGEQFFIVSPISKHTRRVYLSR